MEFTENYQMYFTLLCSTFYHCIHLKWIRWSFYSVCYWYDIIGMRCSWFKQNHQRAHWLWTLLTISLSKWNLCIWECIFHIRTTTLTIHICTSNDNLQNAHHTDITDPIHRRLQITSGQLVWNNWKNSISIESTITTISSPIYYGQVAPCLVWNGYSNHPKMMSVPKPPYISGAVYLVIVFHVLLLFLFCIMY